MKKSKPYNSAVTAKPDEMGRVPFQAEFYPSLSAERQINDDLSEGRRPESKDLLAQFENVRFKMPSPLRGRCRSEAADEVKTFFTSFSIIYGVLKFFAP